MILRETPLHGVLISRVIAGQASWELGIRTGGRITHVNNSPLAGSFSEMRQTIRSASGNGLCSLTIVYPS